eukprot:scaffold1248_cov170-Amphora_coffeaeformis.AAC.16
MHAVIMRAFTPFPYYKIPFIGQYLDGIGFNTDRLKRNFKTLLVKATAERAEQNPDAKQQQTFLEKLVRLNEENDGHLTADRMIGQLITMYLGATDSTSAALNTLLWQLCQDETGLQKELSNECLGLLDISIESLASELPRTRSFVYEVLRVYPPFPFLGVMTNKEIPFANTTLPRGTEILLLTRYTSLHLTSPPDDIPMGPTGLAATGLDPRRWLAERKDGEVEFRGPAKTSPSFLTFGLGPRNCPGRHLAETELLICLHSLLCKFEMSLKPNHCCNVRRICRFSDDVDCDLEIVFRSKKSS